MFVSTEIEIAASPEECHKVVRIKTHFIAPAADMKIKQFLDWENWDKIGSEPIRSISRIPPEKSGPVEKAEKLNVNFSGMNVSFVVQVRLCSYQLHILIEREVM
jgi:hypothetical protein